MWFKSLTGFHEVSPEHVRQNLSVDGGRIKSHVNGKVFTCGELEIPALAELRERINFCRRPEGKLVVHEVIDNVQSLHRDQSSTGALFQVASQFNLLEMSAPSVTPEKGVGIYQYDPTQGPACAIAAGAGTIYRNYFVKVAGQIGQCADHQIDCLADIGVALDNPRQQYWRMKNGYALFSADGANRLVERLHSLSDAELDDLSALLRIGIQRDTEVTLVPSGHPVTQAYCSALAVAYSDCSPSQIEPFARLILQASYEATLCAGILNTISTGNHHLYLTLLGDGAFGNDIHWIIEALEQVLHRFEKTGLDVAIVSHKKSNDYVAALVNRFMA